MGLPATMRELLDRGGVILAANARATRALHLRYAEAMQAENASAWPTPRILDLHSWLAEQWQAFVLTGAEGRVLLNELQELALWENLIEPTLIGISLIEPAHMAALAQQAYALLAEYNQLERLDDSMWLPETNSEPEVFRSWARSFQRECKRHQWLPRCELIGTITHALRWGMLPPPAEIGWLGFDRATPSEADLQSVLESLGTRQHVLSWKVEAQSPPRLYTAQSEKEETAACAAWVRERLDANPGARIGILLPDLQNSRPQLERDLYRVLSPAQLPITAGASPNLPFEFSLGQPLAQVPLVYAALLLLRWLHRPLMQQEISWLLLSSTLGAALGTGAREALANLDLSLRNGSCAPPEMSLEYFLRHPQQGIPAVRALAHDLAAMLEQHRRSVRDASAGEWVRRIAHLLHIARWGERADASSLLFQAREAWERLLDAVAALDLANRPLRFRKFLNTLERAAQDTIFAAESADAPVQVMGAYAASGQSFDAVWFLGATDAAWPIPGRPSPLLPVALQRDAGMPHASPAEDTALAHRTMERIAAGAGEVVYSWAEMSDEAAQRPSSLVNQFVPSTVTVPARSQPPIALETVQDNHWIPFSGAAVATGGQMALKRQANCPFQAFVFQRLQVRELSIAGRGLSPSDRGRLLHKVMELIWSKDAEPHLSGQADLRDAMMTDTLRPLVAAHTEAAMRWLNPAHGDPWQRAYLKAEKERTVNLVLDWLAIEADRQPFQVDQVEQKIELVVGGLALKVRADRIDEVPGGKLLIDYKTGEVSTAGWDGPRPDEPQLPLYAAFGNTQDLVGAVFAQTRWPKTKMMFKGRVEDARASLSATLKDKDPLVTEPYTPETVEQWRDTLEHLSASFVRGEAQVDPHIYPKSCQYCELHGLCRVSESRAFDAAQDAADEEESE
jgi:ATP-dependent helicase/nuclease subunit B